MEMILMVGVPGSGKSYKAKQLRGDNGVILSTDEVFYAERTIDGVVTREYCWDARSLQQAHYINIMKAVHMMGLKIPTIIIDNTNLTEHDRQPYERMADAGGYTVKIVQPDTAWKDDAEECCKRCSHNVPLRTIKDMLQKKDI